MISGQIIGLEKALRVVSSIQKQVKFATAQALNDTAKDVQGFETQDELPSRLTLRRTWWKRGTKYGVNIKFATKQNQQAVIGSQAPWLRDQEHGGVKEAHSHRIAVPTLTHKPKAAIMARGRKPRAMRTKPAVFVAMGAIWQRTTPERLPIKRLFSLVTAARVKKSIDFEVHGVGVANRVYKVHFDKRILAAIASAK